jgi:transcriptional repressor NrdR
MRCPFCGLLESKVVDSRLSHGDEVTRRRRECEGCGRRYTTYERVELLLPMVVKKDGRREPFDRAKVMAGLRRACEKRPVSSVALEALVDDVERSAAESGSSEIEASAIGARVSEGLRALDQVAYVRFASVYRSFQDIQEFRAEVEELERTPPSTGGDAASGDGNSTQAGAPGATARDATREAEQ